jgi:glycosyltransferase involved in cell wall biosynthesis
MNEFRCCAVVPSYDNPDTIRRVVEKIQSEVSDVIVVDDGSAEAGRFACEGLKRDGLATVIRIDRNSGKGVAVQRGLAYAARAGFSHAFQIDGDGQHDLGQVPEFVKAARTFPDHAVFGAPVYDESAPTVRRVARKITKFWVDLEAGRGVITDAMIGFRVYPLEATLALPLRARRMSFDVEVAVLLVWAGVPVLNLPVKVHYPSEEEGGRSHFRPVLDNVRLSWLHSRLCTTASIRWCLAWLPRSAILGRP